MCTAGGSARRVTGPPTRPPARLPELDKIPGLDKILGSLSLGPGPCPCPTFLRDSAVVVGPPRPCLAFSHVFLFFVILFFSVDSGPALMRREVGSGGERTVKCMLRRALCWRKRVQTKAQPNLNYTRPFRYGCVALIAALRPSFFRPHCFPSFFTLFLMFISDYFQCQGFFPGF